MTVSLPKTTSRHVTSLSHYVPPAAVRGNHVYADWFPSTHTVGVTYAAFGFCSLRLLKPISVIIPNEIQNLCETPRHPFTVNETKRLRT